MLKKKKNLFIRVLFCLDISYICREGVSREKGALRKTYYE